MKTTAILLAGAAALALAACGDNREEAMTAETPTGMDAATTAPMPPADGSTSAATAPAPTDGAPVPSADPMAPGQTPPTLPTEPTPDGMGTTPPAP